MTRHSKRTTTTAEPDARRLHRVPMLAAATALAALLAALLAACGGGGGASPAAPIAALPMPPGAPALQGETALDAFNWINYRRGQAGVPALTRNSLLDQAAFNHSSYLRQNNTVSHEQISDKPGFTGVTLGNRLANVNYNVNTGNASVIGEVISAAGQRSGFFHAEELIAAIYHRFVMLEPVFKEVGTGAAVGNANYTYFTADFAARNGFGPGVGRGKVATYPATGQTMVPLNFFSDSESPDPVPNQNEVGYPVSVHADRSATMTVQRFTMRPRGGADLTVRLLAHAGDANTPLSAAAIVPLGVLRANTVYEVTFSGSVDSVAVNLNWEFTTK